MILRDQAEGEAEFNKPARVVIVREYNSAEKTSPDKALTPPTDHTGHIQSVQASTPSMKVDSSVNPDHSIMKKINKDLVKVSAIQLQSKTPLRKSRRMRMLTS